MHIVALALKAVGINVDELTLSTSSLYGSRKAIRQFIGKTIKNTFLPNTPLVAHFDGKLLPDFNGVNIDRLPIVVSGKNVEKLIAIPKVKTGCSLNNDENLWLKQNRVAMINFLQDQLQNTQPRHGYLQLIRLSLITLGVSDPTAVQDTPPGAYHRAHWMAKRIYCLKIFCFREQLKLTVHELQALKRLCLFTVTVYAKAWFCAANSCSAPYNDLCLLQTQELYEKVDCKVGKEAMKKIKRNLWYLSKDLVGMTFVSDLVNFDEKRLMVKALHKPAKK
ncbi:hypothetical protein HELRODRAFT_175915 [Helobdella robusta]|uniref:Uncharacterized protein n=1 Tax=Helobdella robusta TaxID=6412 RepID=T1F9V8_HELRO|nr:hypothetical protein HELRODRAFT_175915 [Helobdella robusta]ESO00474.1 hypothetical protein HELRODRAFT_175915 [Helobdella robusta]